MSIRGSRADVRNQLLAVPEVLALVALLTPEQKLVLGKALRALASRWRVKSDVSWRQNKAPMAFYWRVLSVYARLTSRVLSR